MQYMVCQVSSSTSPSPTFSPAAGVNNATGRYDYYNYKRLEAIEKQLQSMQNPYALSLTSHFVLVESLLVALCVIQGVRLIKTGLFK